MERISDHAISGRTRLLAIALAAGGIMAASPVFAADEVSQERLLNVHKEPGNWLHHHQNYSAHRFSTLKEINRDNVKNLKVAWTMHLGGVEGGAHHAPPRTSSRTWAPRAARSRSAWCWRR